MDNITISVDNSKYKNVTAGVSSVVSFPDLDKGLATKLDTDGKNASATVTLNCLTITGNKAYYNNEEIATINKIPSLENYITDNQLADTLNDYALKTDIPDGVLTEEKAANLYATKLEIPNVGDGTITINQNGNTKGTFTLNQDNDVTIDLSLDASSDFVDLMNDQTIGGFKTFSNTITVPSIHIKNEASQIQRATNRGFELYNYANSTAIGVNAFGGYVLDADDGYATIATQPYVTRQVNKLQTNINKKQDKLVEGHNITLQDNEDGTTTINATIQNNKIYLELDGSNAANPISLNGLKIEKDNPDCVISTFADNLIILSNNTKQPLYGYPRLLLNDNGIFLHGIDGVSIESIDATKIEVGATDISLNTQYGKAYYNNKEIATKDDLSGNNRNIGEIVYSSLPLTDSGLHLLDGALISGDGIYKAFVDYIAKLYTQNPSANYFTTESEWQGWVSTQNVCGRFVYDSSANTVRLPKVTGIIEGTIDETELGNLVKAGLPDISGKFTFADNIVKNNLTAAYVTGSSTGVFKASSVTKNACAYTSATVQSVTSPDAQVNFAASYSNSIYGNSDTVQPQTVKAFVYIVIATSTKTDIEVDIDNITSDINNLISLIGSGRIKLPFGIDNEDDRVASLTSTDGSIDINALRGDLNLDTTESGGKVNYNGIEIANVNQISTLQSSINSLNTTATNLTNRAFLKAASGARNGYMWWNNGLLIQWGTQSASTYGNTTSIVNYPLTFSSTPIVVGSKGQQDGASVGLNLPGNTFNNVGFSWSVAYNSALERTIYWIAIGVKNE